MYLTHWQSHLFCSNTASKQSSTSTLWSITGRSTPQTWLSISGARLHVRPLPSGSTLTCFTTPFSTTSEYLHIQQQTFSLFISGVFETELIYHYISLEWKVGGGTWLSSPKLSKFMQNWYWFGGLLPGPLWSKKCNAKRKHKNNIKHKKKNVHKN